MRNVRCTNTRSTMSFKEAATCLPLHSTCVHIRFINDNHLCFLSVFQFDKCVGQVKGHIYAVQTPPSLNQCFSSCKGKNVVAFANNIVQPNNCFAHTNCVCSMSTVKKCFFFTFCSGKLLRTTVKWIIVENKSFRAGHTLCGNDFLIEFSLKNANSVDQIVNRARKLPAMDVK